MQADGETRASCPSDGIHTINSWLRLQWKTCVRVRREGEQQNCGKVGAYVGACMCGCKSAVFKKVLTGVEAFLCQNLYKSHRIYITGNHLQSIFIFNGFSEPFGLFGQTIAHLFYKASIVECTRCAFKLTTTDCCCVGGNSSTKKSELVHVNCETVLMFLFGIVRVSLEHINTPTCKRSVKPYFQQKGDRMSLKESSQYLKPQKDESSNTLRYAPSTRTAATFTICSCCNKHATTLWQLARLFDSIPNICACTLRGWSRPTCHPSGRHSLSATVIRLPGGTSLEQVSPPFGHAFLFPQLTPPQHRPGPSLPSLPLKTRHWKMNGTRDGESRAKYTCEGEMQGKWNGEQKEKEIEMVEVGLRLLLSQSFVFCYFAAFWGVWARQTSRSKTRAGSME